MAVMYTHSVFLRFLLIFVLLDVTRGIVSSVKGRFRGKDFPEERRFNKRGATNGTKSRQYCKNETDICTEWEGQTRTTIALHCNTSKLISVGEVNTTVIWVKMHNESFTILTAGMRVITDDKRFLVSNNKVDPKEWILFIRHSKREDEGLYKCQVCSQSNFSNSIYVNLKLIEAWATILGDPERKAVKVGSPLRLSCELKDSIEAPKYIFWYHDDRVINYDLNDGATVREGRQGSELIFPRAQRNHTGNYSCVPSNAREASVEVKIQNKTSEMKNDEKNGGKKTYSQDLVINMLELVSIFFVYR